jgi:signal peptidase I
MEPYIETGDVLIVQRNNSPSFSVNIGDIVAFRDNTGRIIAHRIVGMRNDMYLVKGDNVEKPDGYIKYEDIIGKVVDVVPSENLIARAYAEGIL